MIPIHNAFCVYGNHDHIVSKQSSISGKVDQKGVITRRNRLISQLQSQQKRFFCLLLLYMDHGAIPDAGMKLQ